MSCFKRGKEIDVSNLLHRFSRLPIFHNHVKNNCCTDIYFIKTSPFLVILRFLRQLDQLLLYTDRIVWVSSKCSVFFFLLLQFLMALPEMSHIYFHNPRALPYVWGE